MKRPQDIEHIRAQVSLEYLAILMSILATIVLLNLSANDNIMAMMSRVFSERFVLYSLFLRLPI